MFSLLVATVLLIVPALWQHLEQLIPDGSRPRVRRVGEVALLMVSSH